MNFVRLFSSNGPWAFVLAVRKLIRVVEDFQPTWIHTVPISSCKWTEDTKWTYCRPVASRGGKINYEYEGHEKTWAKLPDEVVKEISERADVVIRFGFGLLEGDVLKATEHGVLTFQGYDIRKYRGLGTTERFLDDTNKPGATLQRYEPNVNSGRIVIIDHVDIDDICHMEQIHERVHELQIEMIIKGTERLQDTSFAPVEQEDLGPHTPISRRGELRYAYGSSGKSSGVSPGRCLADFLSKYVLFIFALTKQVVYKWTLIWLRRCTHGQR